MTMPDGPVIMELVLLGICIVLSAFFSSSEAAFLSVQKVRMQHLLASNVPGARRMVNMAEHPERLLPTILLGNNLVNTAAAALGTLIALSFIETSTQAILTATVTITLILLVIGETIPKTIAARHPERMALAYALPLQWVELILFPFTRILQSLSRSVNKIVGGDIDSRALITAEEIKILISVGRAAGTVEQGEAEMIRKVFRFGDRLAREMMTPRPEIIWVEKGTPLKQFLILYEKHYHTRFPVFEGQTDNVIGVLSVKDVVRALGREELKPQDPVTRLIRPAHFVPESKPVATLFSEIQESRSQMAIVVDEFGGVAGLVTQRQLVSEIVGPSPEEGTEPEEEFKAIDEHTFQVDAGMLVEEANEKLEVHIPNGKYETIAGFILEYLGYIPQEGEALLSNDLRLIVSEMRGLKIEKVTLTRLTSPTTDENS
jgi:putative hemolysin